MKCEILSWGEQEVNCKKELEGDCANCGAAWNFMGLFGISLFSPNPLLVTYKREGKDLVTEVSVKKDGPVTHRCTISCGKYTNFEKI